MSEINYSKWSKIFIIFCTVLLIVFDVGAFLSPQTCDTISCTMLTWSREHPTIPFLAGMLCGHLFVPQHVIHYQDGHEQNLGS